MYDLIVIGGGPAGLTATIYAIRKRLNVLLISEDLGGKTNYYLDLPDVASYQVIRGVEVVDKFKSELEYLDFARLMERVNKVEKMNDGFVVHTEAGSLLEARAVIVASGTRQEWLNVPGEREYLSKGLCYSALSYAPLFIEKETVVVGEDDLALRSAAELATVAPPCPCRRTFKAGDANAVGQEAGQSRECYPFARLCGDTSRRQWILQHGRGEKQFRTRTEAEGGWHICGERPTAEYANGSRAG